MVEVHGADDGLVHGQRSRRSTMHRHVYRKKGARTRTATRCAPTGTAETHVDMNTGTGGALRTWAPEEAHGHTQSNTTKGGQTRRQTRLGLLAGKTSNTLWVEPGRSCRRNPEKEAVTGCNRTEQGQGERLEVGAGRWRASVRAHAGGADGTSPARCL